MNSFCVLKLGYFEYYVIVINRSHFQEEPNHTTARKHGPLSVTEYYVIVINRSHFRTMLSCGRLIWLLSHPLPASPGSRLSLFLHLSVCCRLSLLTGEGLKWRGISQIIRPRKSCFSINHQFSPIIMITVTWRWGGDQGVHHQPPQASPRHWLQVPCAPRCQGDPLPFDLTFFRIWVGNLKSRYGARNRSMESSLELSSQAT